jgi:dienelactone hydrolase
VSLSDRARDPLFLNAASQDRALFLTWNTAPDSPTVMLRCRRPGAPWRTLEGDARGYALLRGLENDATYECYAERELATGETIASSIVTQTPRLREFAVGRRFFTSQSAADRWLARNRISPWDLYLRGERVRAWEPCMPDGGYTDASGQPAFFLLRHADETFRAPDAPRPPEEVRAVLKHAIWRDTNPFDHPAQFPMPATPMAARVGTVDGFATAVSFAISYHPSLSSRCTHFSPPNPSPGRIAIYLNGHSGHTTRFGAHTVNALMQRGWQVIAMDMPLIGENAADTSDALSRHNDFLSWPATPASPVGLFLQPLKAVVDDIYRQHGEGAELTVMLMGFSGGGWTSLMYGALDERVHYVVGVAGGMPMSQWVRKRPTRPADFEQLDPQIFGAVRYEDIMPAAGSRAAFYVYNQHDPCCFALRPDDPFLAYLRDAGAALGKPIGVYVDTETTRHEVSGAALAALDEFLAAIESATPSGP